MVRLPGLARLSYNPGNLGNLGTLGNLSNLGNCGYFDRHFTTKNLAGVSDVFLNPWSTFGSA